MNTSTVKIVFVEPAYVICPECNEKIKGWMNDPRDRIDKCEHCGCEVHIDENAELRMDY